MKNPTNHSGSTLEVQESFHSKSLGKSLVREYFSSGHPEKKPWFIQKQSDCGK